MNILYGLNKTRAEATIVATDATIRQTIESEVKRLGNDTDLNHIDVSQVTNMGRLFFDHARFFNGDISQWDTSNVTNMETMFYNCYKFNGDISNWNTSNVTNMRNMFYNCENFNQPLNSWDTSNVTNMNNMFYSCENFNQPLNNWDTSNVTDMGNMFDRCINFNGNISQWDVSSVTNMNDMFFNCISFNQPLNNWDVSNVKTMNAMFDRCESFNQPLNNWNTSNVTSMNAMFYNCISFNQPLNNWNVSNVTNMRSMFYNCTSFNQNLNNWDVSKVKSMDNMFNNTPIKSSNMPNGFSSTNDFNNLSNEDKKLYFNNFKIVEGAKFTVTHAVKQTYDELITQDLLYENDVTNELKGGYNSFSDLVRKVNKNVSHFSDNKNNYYIDLVEDEPFGYDNPATVIRTTYYSDWEDDFPLTERDIDNNDIDGLRWQVLNIFVLDDKGKPLTEAYAKKLGIR